MGYEGPRGVVMGSHPIEIFKVDLFRCFVSEGSRAFEADL